MVRGSRFRVSCSDCPSVVKLLLVLLLSKCQPANSLIPPPTDTRSQPPILIFPGGGIYFYWQAGVVTHLREQGYRMDRLAGASAGALTATLAATDVDYYKATELALQLAADANVWTKPGGLQGIWGELIEQWLQELLPTNLPAQIQQHERLGLLLTRIPSFSKHLVTKFDDRNDLIRCNLASVHIPWFMDSRLFSSFRQKSYMDGSFLSSVRDFTERSADAIVLDHKLDPKYRNVDIFSFVQAVSPETLYTMLDDGRNHAIKMEEQGLFQHLPKDFSKQQ